MEDDILGQVRDIVGKLSMTIKNNLRYLKNRLLESDSSLDEEKE